MSPTVFIPEPISSKGIELLKSKVDIVAPWLENKEWSEEESRSLLNSSNAVIVRLFKVGKEDIDRSSDLRVIAKHGVGVDNIDLQAAAERQIPVVYTPTANSNAVAEHTIALMMALARKIGPAAETVRQGRFSERIQFQGVELAGKTLGVIGLGRIGKRVAEIASKGLGMRVVAYDPFVQLVEGDEDIVVAGRVEKVLGESDFLSLHVPLTAETKHLINGKTIELLKTDCRILNTSRGAIIDERVLVKALQEGGIAGAALDVFEEEPIPTDHLLCTAPNILLTPHISSSTKESLDRMAVDAAQGVLDVLEGRPSRYPYPMEKLS